MPSQIGSLEESPSVNSESVRLCFRKSFTGTNWRATRLSHQSQGFYQDQLLSLGTWVCLSIMEEIEFIFTSLSSFRVLGLYSVFYSRGCFNLFVCLFSFLWVQDIKENKQASQGRRWEGKDQGRKQE